jgi:hypothetical protein
MTLKYFFFIYIEDKTITHIVLGSLYAFVNSKSNYPITYREVLYQKELIRELEILKKTSKRSQHFYSSGRTTYLYEF